MSKSYLSNQFKKEKETFFAKAADLKANKNKIIDLSLGDPDLITAQEIIKQAALDSENGYTHYSHPRGDQELRNEIIRYYQNNYQQELDTKEIMVTVGACHGTFLALRAILNPGEEVIIPTPYFAPYKEQVKLAGGKPVFIENEFKKGFELNIEAIKKAINEKTKAIIINSPNNPTGAIYSKTILDKLMDLARKNDFLILSDEVYESFDFKNKFYSLINYKKDLERIILVNSFSKTFAMTGWRLGFVIANPEILRVMQDLNEGICYSAPTISQRAAIAALKNEKILKEEISSKFLKRMQYAKQRLKENKLLELKAAAGTFYLFPSIKKTGLSAENFALRLLAEAGILVLPGNDFGDKKGEFIRIACTLSIENLKKAFDKIDLFTQKI